MSEQRQKNIIKRQIAYKVRIKDLIGGTYIKNEGEWAPNYIKINDKHISRINLIGAVVLKPSKENLNYQSIILDDGTGKIPVRIFEDTGIFDSIGIGDVILLIGRPREFGSEKYIVPEILKKLNNNEWIKVRQLELKLKNKGEEKIKEEPIEEVKDNSPSDKIFNLIKNIDSGEGADTEEVISKAQVEGAEQIIKRLLEEGDVFEVRPGKLKVLE